jgi:hypothetical protein
MRSNSSVDATEVGKAGQFPLVDRDAIADQLVNGIVGASVVPRAEYGRLSPPARPDFP